jgi:hypothetical protein
MVEKGREKEQQKRGYMRELGEGMGGGQGKEEEACIIKKVQEGKEKRDGEREGEGKGWSREAQ